VRLYRSFVSTLNSKERQNNYLCELSRLHPRPKGRGFTLHMDKPIQMDARFLIGANTCSVK
jgi:hypothetical protein